MTQHKMKTQKMTEVEKRMMTEVETQYVYLLQTREFLNSKEPVYKIGRSKQDNYSRFSQYDLGSVLLFQSSCSDNIKLEREIIDLFSKKYEHIKIVGKEWFRGDVDEMRVDFCDIIKNSITTGKLKNNDTISVQDVVVEEGCVEDIVVEEGCVEDIVVEERIHQYLLEECTQQYLIEEVIQDVVEEKVQGIVEEKVRDIVEECEENENIQVVVGEIDIIIEDVKNDNIIIEDVKNDNIIIEDVKNDNIIIEDVKEDVKNDIIEDVVICQEVRSELSVNNVKGRFYCRTCHFETDTNGHLKQHSLTQTHLKILEGVVTTPYKCCKCERGYQTKSGLQKHKLVCKAPEVASPEVELPIVPEIVSLDLHTKIENLEKVIGKLTSLVENNLTK
jgi:hypothetical protein